jgi:hypothetical protein
VKSTPKGDRTDTPKRRVEDDVVAARTSAWDAEETVRVRASEERKAAAERAERLRAVTGRRRGKRW